MKKLLIVALLVALTGCVNIMYHIPAGQVTKVYHPTTFVACKGVGSWWNSEYKAKYPIEAAWMELTWLVWIVDLPCEAVMDTLTFPYDLYRKNYFESRKSSKGNAHGFGSGSGDSQYYLKDSEYRLNIGE